MSFADLIPDVGATIQVDCVRFSAWWESNPQLTPYKDAALTTELHAAWNGTVVPGKVEVRWLCVKYEAWMIIASFEAMGLKGVEPLPCDLKDRCAAITPQPQLMETGYLFIERTVHGSVRAIAIV